MNIPQKKNFTKTNKTQFQSTQNEYLMLDLSIISLQKHISSTVFRNQKEGVQNVLQGEIWAQNIFLFVYLCELVQQTFNFPPIYLTDFRHEIE